jgi:apolipoprotein N-acyltransferase
MLFLALFAGLIFPLAFAPISAWPVAIVSLYIFYRIIDQLNIKQVFWHGLVFGIGYFAVGVSWVFVSIHEYGNTHPALAALITSFFIVILSLYLALTAVTSKYLCNKLHSHTSLVIILPSMWLLVEIFRSWLFTGFPWLLIGYSQINSPLVGYAPIISVYGMSFLTIFTGSLLYLIIHNKNYKLLSIILLIWIGGWYLSTINWTRPININQPIKLSMIQGNIKPNDKFLLEDPYQATWDLYAKPSMQKFKQGIDLVIWPENSLTVPFPYSTSFVQNLDNLAKEHNSTIILGLPIEVAGTKNYHNAILAIGANHGNYGKVKLVPFGEYLPLEQYLRGMINFFDIPMSNFISADKEQKIFIFKKYNLLPLICYEIAYPEFVRYKMHSNIVNAIVAISEDGWFGNSWGPHQHLDIARMRAIETGKYVLRSTTSGISATINTKGDIVASSPQFAKYTLTSEFYAYTGNTPWVRFGGMPWLILLFIQQTVLFSWIAWRKVLPK